MVNDEWIVAEVPGAADDSGRFVLAEQCEPIAIHATRSLAIEPLCGAHLVGLLPTFVPWRHRQASWEQRCPACLERAPARQTGSGTKDPRLIWQWRWGINSLALFTDRASFRLPGSAFFRRRTADWRDIAGFRPRRFQSSGLPRSAYVRWAIDLCLSDPKARGAPIPLGVPFATAEEASLGAEAMNAALGLRG